MLYPECDIIHDTSFVKRRKHFRTECHINRESSSSYDSTSDSSFLTSDDENFINTLNRRNLERQDAVDKASSGSCDSNPFEYIKYFVREGEEQDINSFVDHGQALEFGDNSCVTNGVQITDLDDDEFLLTNQTEPTQKLLGTFKQTSESSENSSFDHFTKPYMACEDLVNIDENAVICDSLGVLKKQDFSVDKMRHSMPSQLVANRFNVCPNTRVCIPSWQCSDSDEHDRYEKVSSMPEVDANEFDKEDSSVSHSSSLDIPINVIPVPNKVLAELLYNPGGSNESVIRPPTMFQTDDIPFRKHSINSDKQMRTSVNKDSRKLTSGTSSVDLEPQEMKRKSLRRCVSHQYLELLNKSVDFSEFNKTDPSFKNICTCCNASQCHSPRSSDSGMAGSCTITTSDQPNGFLFTPDFQQITEASLDSYKFEDMIPCTTSFPMGPTIIPEDNIYAQKKKLSERPKLGSSSSASSCRNLSNCEVKDNNATKEIGEQRLKFSNNELKHSSSLHNITLRNNLYIAPNDDDRELVKDPMNLEGRDGRSQSEERAAFADVSDTRQVFRTGLYAHWWLKAPLSIAALKDVAGISGKATVSAIVWS